MQLSCYLNFFSPRKGQAGSLPGASTHKSTQCFFDFAVPDRRACMQIFNRRKLSVSHNFCKLLQKWRLVLPATSVAEVYRCRLISMSCR